MYRRAWFLVVVALLAAAIAGCENGEPEAEAESSSSSSSNANLFVSQFTGSDSNSGSASSPFQTITHALTQAASGETVQVLFGLYDTANGEIFPLVVPAGVTLRGDPVTKGAGSGVTPTVIQGTGLVSGVIEAALQPGTGSEITGFYVTGASPSGSNYGMLGVLQNDNVTLRRNTFTNADASGLYIDNSSNHLITGNDIRDNVSAAGIVFVNGGSNTAVELNLITNNNYGVEEDVIAGDLGGGPARSAGGNTIYCNLTNDLWLNVSGTLHAINNAWDHNPPSGNDFFNGGSAALLFNNATVMPGCATP